MKDPEPEESIRLRGRKHIRPKKKVKEKISMKVCKAKPLGLEDFTVWLEL